MPTYHANYHRRADPNTHMWYSVETPQGFQEVKLPACSDDMTLAQKRQLDALYRLAARHKTTVKCNEFRRVVD